MPQFCVGTNVTFEQSSKVHFTAVRYNYAPCEPRLIRGGAARYASAIRSARGAICAAVLASELADTAWLDYRKENQ